MADKKTPQQIEAENKRTMARAAIKVAMLTCSKEERAEVPEELQAYWDSLETKGWKEHLELFTQELKKYKQAKVKEIIFDVNNYIKDCKRLVPKFNRSKEEVLLMVAIGQIDVGEFFGIVGNLPNNREKLDRKIHKQIKMLDWQDAQDLDHLDELTEKLDNPRIKKKEIDQIDSEIQRIEDQIQARKSKRDELAIKLVEWKARGNIDIAASDGSFRLDA